MKRIFVMISLMVSCSWLHADEGMWLPLLLEGYTMEEMQAMGFKLTAEDVYSMNKASLKDAVVLFGGGCTGEMISPEGLLITNYHCAYSRIQSHSSLENDYLSNGFWAKSKDSEMVNPGLSVRFLEKIEDVTDEIVNAVDDETPEAVRDLIINEKRREIAENVSTDEFTQAVVKPFFYGNQYFLFVYKIFKDVRLVGAPPSAIGKFGGDTDNWMWPRHTGDFALFRIYADKNNEPANYSKDNKPYNPKKYLSISLKGYEKGDFSMVMGFPGNTQRYITSHEVDIIMNEELPQKIGLRDHRLAVMNNAMNQSARVRMQYTAKYNRVSNAWKKWQGMIRGLQRLDAVETKQNNEEKFMAWVNEDGQRQEIFDSIIREFEEVYEGYDEPYIASGYWNEAVFGTELVRQVYKYWQVLEKYNMGDEEEAEIQLNKVVQQMNRFFEDYYQPIDREVFPGLMTAYKKNLPSKYHPSFFKEIVRKYDGDSNDYASDLFAKTLFLDSVDLKKLTRMPIKRAVKKIKKDNAMEIFQQFVGIYRNMVFPTLNSLEMRLDSLYRIYVTGLQRMYPDSLFSPDANLTMRVTYGAIDNYFPADGVEYDYYTTLTGVMEKEDPSVPDYEVPTKLKELYEKKDFGPYSQNGELRTCFIARNHTSGGNSGSPVLNANGHLIGVNFDRNWEGTMSDIMYDPTQCRNISIDIRYALFIIDKFAGAKHLIKEMDIIQ